MIVTNQLLDSFKEITREFLYAMQDRDFDLVWHHLITNEASNLIAVMSFPLMAYNEGKIDQLLTAPNKNEDTLSMEQGLALAFQMDLEGVRTGLFSGMSTNLTEIGWTELSDEVCFGFAEEDFAILIAKTAGTNLIMPLIKQGDQYLVDFEALLVFSMFYPPSRIYQIGLRAVELGRLDSAMVFFELAASLFKPIYRLKKILFDHPIAGKMITDARRTELTNEQTSVLMARDQVLRMMAAMDKEEKRIDTTVFLSETFRGYSEITNTDFGEKERDTLWGMDDQDLRSAIAKILCGVNPVEAQREATKPHSPAEIADMEVRVQIQNERYLLCMPFKSGKEIKTNTVPVDIAYQIIRPFMYFPNCIVVFITAKPCSQHLLNYIKLAIATQGWAIEVIQNGELGRLLKINGII